MPGTPQRPQPQPPRQAAPPAPAPPPAPAAPEQRTSAPGRLPFLQPGDIAPDRPTLMLVIGNTRTYNSKWGLKFNIDVQVGNRQYAMSFKASNPGLRVLIDKLAAGEVIEIERATYKGNAFVHIVGAGDQNNMNTPEDRQDDQVPW